jgi:hypothetical protein
MNAAWRRWAAEGGHPIVVLRSKDGSAAGTCDITLEPR